MAIHCPFSRPIKPLPYCMYILTIPEDAKLVWIDFENPTKTIKHYSLNDSILLGTT